MNDKGVIPAPAMDACAAPRKAESSIKANKTKNLSKKHKERTSIAGGILKLIDQGQGSSSGMGAIMSMILMRQMEHILNKIMDNQDRWEEKERKKEHKRCKKRCAKKKAKKARKRAALEPRGPWRGREGIQQQQQQQQQR